MSGKLIAEIERLQKEQSELKQGMKLAESELKDLSMKFDALNANARKHIAKGNFALPGKRKYPIHDISHARNALARSSGKPEESTVRAAVYRKYPQLKKNKKKKLSSVI